MTTNTYPFDPTGTASTNLITGELQTLPVVSVEDYFFIIPKAAPYFRETMVVKKYPTGEILKEGVDYVCTHMFYAATYQTGRPVYGSISFYDHTLAGSVSMTYQTVGGDWTITDSEIVRILTSVVVNPRITTWEQITTLPFQFPPIAHEYDIEDFTGAKDVVVKLKSIEDALLARNQLTAAMATDISSHLANFNNPHKTNKLQIGLGSVDNFPTASPTEAAGLTANNRFMTPALTKIALDALLGQNFMATFTTLVSEVGQNETTLNSHVTNFNNPHKTSKAHVGLGSVDNFATATSSEAIAGVAKDRFMTPFATAAAINDKINNFDLSSKLDVVVFEDFVYQLSQMISEQIPV